MTEKRRDTVPQGTAQASTATDPRNAMRKFRDTYNALGESLEAALREAQKRSKEALREATSWETDENYKKQYTEFCRQLDNALDGARGRENEGELARAARLSFNDSVGQIEDEARRRDKEIRLKYQNSVEAVRTAVLEEVHRAYDSYISSVVTAWTEVDPKAVDVRTLAGIGEILIAAAQTVDRFMES